MVGSSKQPRNELTRHNVVPDGNGRDAFADGLDNSAGFVAWELPALARTVGSRPESVEGGVWCVVCGLCIGPEAGHLMFSMPPCGVQALQWRVFRSRAAGAPSASERARGGPGRPAAGRGGNERGRRGPRMEGKRPSGSAPDRV